jgi:hypothetical protein
MSRRPGRPPIDPTDPSVVVKFSLPAKRYDAMYRAASAHCLTVPELIRRALSPELKSQNPVGPAKRR